MRPAARTPPPQVDRHGPAVVRRLPAGEPSRPLGVVRKPALPPAGPVQRGLSLGIANVRTGAKVQQHPRVPGMVVLGDGMQRNSQQRGLQVRTVDVQTCCDVVGEQAPGLRFGRLRQQPLSSGAAIAILNFLGRGVQAVKTLLEDPGRRLNGALARASIVMWSACRIATMPQTTPPSRIETKAMPIHQSQRHTVQLQYDRSPSSAWICRGVRRVEQDVHKAHCIRRINSRDQQPLRELADLVVDGGQSIDGLRTPWPEEPQNLARFALVEHQLRCFQLGQMNRRHVQPR